MDVVRITKTDDPYFDEFLSVYSISFPIFEQRVKEQHIYAFNQPNYNVNCYIENNSFIGFIVFWDFDSYIYIEHLAIHPDRRGQNYGSLVLNQFIEQNEKSIILEIDPLVDDISVKRYHFYKHLGFIKNNHKHTHPAYREGFQDHELIILSTQKVLSKKEYEQFYSDLKNIVMNKMEAKIAAKVLYR